MKIVQILPTLNPGDATGNHTVALGKVLCEMGYQTEIYAENISPKCRGLCKHISQLPKLTSKDIVIYHKAIGTELSFQIAKYKAKKILDYHNITPPHFFKDYQASMVQFTEYGLQGAQYLADKVDYCLADSDFNKKDLINMGYQCPIDVLPILIPFSDYAQTPDRDVLHRYLDGRTNIVFTGRIAPNKKQEDIIEAFYYYKKNCDDQARLFLVGSYGEEEPYYLRLRKYVEELNVPDVYFTGHIPFSQILAYYRLADVFLCMSEHEGFCVPLVEAMYFRIPILAYNSSAVPYTLGGSGLMFDEKDPMLVAKLIQRVVTDKALRVQLVRGQSVRLEDFQYEKVKTMFQAYLHRFLKEIQ